MSGSIGGLEFSSLDIFCSPLSLPSFLFWLVMKKESDNNNPENTITRDDKLASMRFIYEYTDSYEKRIESNTNSINTKLASIIGFSGVLLKFAGELNDSSSGWQNFSTWNSYESYLTESKALCCVLLVTSILFCLIGLSTRGSGNIPRPLDVILPENINSISELGFRKRITERLAQSSEEYIEVRDRRSENLNCALTMLFFAILCFAFNIILTSFCGSTICSPHC